MLTALHEFLVDDLAGIILARLDMNRFLYNGICTATECLSSTILEPSPSAAPLVATTPVIPDRAQSGGAFLVVVSKRVDAQDSRMPSDYKWHIT